MASAPGRGAPEQLIQGEPQIHARAERCDGIRERVDVLTGDFERKGVPKLEHVGEGRAMGCVGVGVVASRERRDLLGVSTEGGRSFSGVDVRVELCQQTAERCRDLVQCRVRQLLGDTVPGPRRVPVGKQLLDVLLPQLRERGRRRVP
jgi:hypothetical protein